jgi:hypothetical protein
VCSRSNASAPRIKVFWLLFFKKVTAFFGEILMDFFDSPANRSGLAIWLGTAITAAVQYFLLHLQPPSADLLGLVLGLVKVIQPENSVTVAQMQRAIADVQRAMAVKSPAAIGAVVADAEAIVDGVVKNS